jgi:hypothetical protein
VIARIAAARLVSQRLTKAAPRDPASLVAWFGAVQAQDFGAAKWALGLRLAGRSTDASVARAVDEGRILRTHVMRPTWHFVTAADIRWLLALTAPRVHRALQWGHGQLGTDADLRSRAMKVIERVLTKEPALTRPELGDHLERARIPVRHTALALVVIHAELEALVCSGPRRGTQSTYMLLDRRVPRAASLDRDEAIAELTTRYLRSHAPATVRDFCWWSGLTAADARRGLDIVRARAHAIEGLTYWTLRSTWDAKPSDAVHLLPVYDEYLVAYRDLAAVPRGATRWGILPQAIVSRGEVVGEWKPVRERERVVVDVKARRKLTRRERDALERSVARYGRFYGCPAAFKRTRTDA